jgi:ribonuclease E
MAAPRYTGPTPADPFAGHVDDIMAAMEAAEAAAEAAAQAAATLAGRRARMTTTAPGETMAAEPASAPPQLELPAAETAQLALSPAQPAVAAEPEPGEAAAPPSVADTTEAPERMPAAAAAAVAPEPAPPAVAPRADAAPEPVQGPAVQPRSVDEVATDAPRRSGWWRR